MTRIDRGDCPEVLLTEGAAARARDCASYDAGERKFSAEPKIYGHADVKSVLVRMQRGRCAYCEARVQPVDDGTIDHYRPTAAVKQAHGAEALRPGYYWLAYDWQNLLLVCRVCNRIKSFLFPLANPSARARTHLDDLLAEEPLMIDPTRDEPADFVGFRENVCFAIDDNPRGAKMAELLLNRDGLVEERREYLIKVQALRSVVSSATASPLLRMEAEALLAEMAAGAAGEYLGMLRAAGLI